MPRKFAKKRGGTTAKVVRALAKAIKPSSTARGGRRAIGSAYSYNRGGVTVNNKSYGRVGNRLPGISPKFYGVHDYVQRYTFQAGTLGVFGVEQVWNLNSMFDPDQTGVGHQPYLRDQLAALYGRYRVNAIRIELTITDPSADGLVIANAIQSPSDISTLANTSVETMGERPAVDLKYVNNTGSQKVVYRRFLHMSKALGISRVQFAADTTRYSADVGANPTAMPTLHTAIANMTGSATTTVQITSKFTFYVEWSERNAVVQS